MPVLTSIPIEELEVGDVVISWHPRNSDRRDRISGTHFKITLVEDGVVSGVGFSATAVFDLLYDVEREYVAPTIVRVPCGKCGSSIHPALAKFEHLCR